MILARLTKYSAFILLGMILGCQSSNKDVIGKDDENSTGVCRCDDLRYDDVMNEMSVLDNEEPFSGRCEEWYNNENKQIQEMREYDKGKMEGIMKKWHRNGVLADERTFHINLQHGQFRQWDSTGTLTYSAWYQYGKFVRFLDQE